MNEEIKKNYNDALFNLEKVIQDLRITEVQQEQLTQSLADFGECFDNIITWLIILDKSVGRLDSRLSDLGKTDSHIGEQTLEARLSNIEGMQSIFCNAHKGHTNYSKAEYDAMHESYDDVQERRGQIEALQKKMDRITKLLENAKFEITGKEALVL